MVSASKRRNRIRVRIFTMHQLCYSWLFLIFCCSCFYRLETLEQQETERLERLRRQVLPTAPEPLGFAGGDSQTSLVKQRAILQKQNAVDLKTLPRMPRFWEKYAKQENAEQQQTQLQSSTPVKSPQSFDSMMDDSPSAASEMDFSKDITSIFSPN